MGDIIVTGRRAWRDCDVVATWLEHLRHGRWAGAGACVAAELIIETPPSLPHGGLVRTRGNADGPRLLREHAEAFARTWEGGTTAAHEVSEAGDDLVLVHTTGAICARATGRGLALDVRTLVFLDRGLITGLRSYWRDTVEAVSCLEPARPQPVRPEPVTT